MRRSRVPWQRSENVASDEWRLFRFYGRSFIRIFIGGENVRCLSVLGAVTHALTKRQRHTERNGGQQKGGRLVD